VCAPNQCHPTFSIALNPNDISRPVLALHNFKVPFLVHTATLRSQCSSLSFQSFDFVANIVLVPVPWGYHREVLVVVVMVWRVKNGCNRSSSHHFYFWLFLSFFSILVNMFFLDLFLLNFLELFNGFGLCSAIRSNLLPPNALYLDFLLFLLLLFIFIL
jgi:hypothetical protein